MNKQILDKPLGYSDSAKIVSIVNNPSQTIILTAHSGFGINEYAKEIAKLISKDVVTISGTLASGSIGKDDIEPIKRIVKNKIPTKLVIVIENAHNMSDIVQNKLLKLLEEPTSNLHYILASEDQYSILPTILSRSQIFQLNKISPSQTDELLKQYGVDGIGKQTQIKVIASGLPSEIIRLASDNEYFKLRAEQMSDAKVLLQGSVYESIVICNKYKDSRDNAIRLLDDCLKLTEYLVINQTIKAKSAQKIEIFLKAIESIRANGNVRINLLSCVV